MANTTNNAFKTSIKTGDRKMTLFQSLEANHKAAQITKIYQTCPIVYALLHREHLSAAANFRNVMQIYIKSHHGNNVTFFVGIFLHHSCGCRYVMYWLLRAAPSHMLRLQNGRFDAPDRMFNSIQVSLHTC